MPDTAAVSDHEAEVAAAPCDFLSLANQAGSDSVDGLFARIVDRLQMQVDTAAKIEAALDGCGDFGGELNVDHRRLSALVVGGVA